ncbi:piggyBac transposable element-derived protein 4-like [Schistocerca nitens]|uniref:piggyBac transposable element-derived protein 4-like n=1 Tax=Schistocerca nitens TaxID=7011 RepID=UPI002118DCA0|nr:piggyBac transposable element-derived protein 4-like [Schistocerca nitens]
MDEASDNPPPPSFVYAEVPGPKHIRANATPIDFFQFQLLLRFLHFVDNSKLHPPGHPLYDPTAKFQVLVDIANNVFRRYYTPHQQLSVDGSLVGTKAHSQLIQYLPNKHHRWGVIFWMLCDSGVNYCLGFYAYRGAKSGDDKNEIKEIYSQKLYSVCTYLTGTIRRNRKFLPCGLLLKYAVGQLKFFKKSFILLCGFRQKKSQRNPVLLVSTSSSARSSETTIRNRQSAKKPDVILEYNKYMGGIDSSDMMAYCYLDERTVKMWKKVVFSIIARLLLNAYVLYKESLNPSDKPLTRLKFNSIVICKLSQQWFQARTTTTSATDINVPAPTVYGVETLPGRKERYCSVCSTKDEKRRL